MSKFTIAALAAAALVVPGAAWADDSGKDSAPGQTKAAGEPAEGHAYGQAQQQESQPENRSAKADTAPNGNAYGQSKARAQKAPKAKPAPKAQSAPNGNAYGHSKTKPAPGSRGNSDVAHQKTTICHATGSETNPYVTITVSNSALKAHGAHQDGRDIIPAPAGGCPGGGGNTTPDGDKEGKVTICHATGSATNPYVVITISENALKAHEAHQDGRDIIPAPAEGCPGTTPETPPLLTPGGGDLPGAGDNVTPQGGVLGEFEESPDVAVPAANEDTGDVAADRESGDTVAGVRLPFTGLDLLVVALAGAALLLAGIAMQRILSRQGH